MSPAEGMIYPIRRRLLQRNKNFGFTLLELIFVAVILAFIATLALPQFRKTFNSLKLQSFVSDVVSFARYAQVKAITDGRPSKLVLDTEQKFLKVEIEGADEEWHLEKSKSIPDFILIDLQDSEGEIIFYSNGTADECSIKVGIPAGKNYAISTESATGYVKVEELSQQ